ncbi:uncharacterized protein B0H18DRAFT_1024747 [Fomitopsis serialis]|uniref:uncharacterized protein n=1 Tax=Fomitopsis serialis TaxID=139415 RepID=UPI00200880EE|nr:uncharacterized protein B0H18DRAFT_1024747 [Neoantrodia serialis]KAH9920305.1 hypothetical protein B0H18DRAFT_1024747 [Neoantrodia serialis]
MALNEPFLLMSKAAKGAAAAKLIQDATSASGSSYSLSSSSCLTSRANSEQYAQHYSLLQLFAYKTYQDYLQHKDVLPSLNQAQITKLKHLSLVSLAMESRIIRGKLDQKEQQFDVEYTVGRDVEPGKIESLLASLKNWAETTSAVMTTLDERLAALTQEAAQTKAKQDAYDQRYQTTLKEVLDKQKEAKAKQRAAAYPGQTGLTPAGIAERDRQRERERQEREEQERRQREKEQGKDTDKDTEDDGKGDSMDVDDPPESGKGKKKAPHSDAAQRQQRKRNRP